MNDVQICCTRPIRVGTRTLVYICNYIYTINMISVGLASLAKQVMQLVTTMKCQYILKIYTDSKGNHFTPAAHARKGQVI